MDKYRVLGAQHLANRKMGDPQRQNNFELEIVGLARDITLQVNSFPFPTKSHEVIEIMRGNSKYKLAGPVSYESGEMNITDSIDLDTEAVIYEWTRIVHDPETDAIGFAVDYKRTATLTQFAPNGTVERQWQLIGVWPSSVNYGEANVESTDKKTIAITLEYDRAFVVKDDTRNAKTQAGFR